MNNYYLAFRQIKYENRAFWRNPPAAFFTFILPIMFLVIFNLIFGKNDFKLPGGITHTSTFYVPSIIALSVVSACYTNIAMGLSFSRDQGLLKRIRGTPLPTWAFIFGRIANTSIVAVILVTIIMLIGVIFYDVSIPRSTMPAMLVTLILGAGTFCSLGIAITTVVPNADAAPAIINASILPLLFISDVLIPMQDAPSWLNGFTTILPVKPFSEALQTTFNPFETGMGFEFGYLGIMSIWMVIGILISVRCFSWEPRQ